MSRRRRKPGSTTSARRETQRGERQAQSVERRLRRPTKGHTPKRPRMPGDGTPRRVRGDRHPRETLLELGIGETRGLAEIDEVAFVSPRIGGIVTQMPAVDSQTELSVVNRLMHKRLPELELEWMPGQWLSLQALGSKPLVIYCQPGTEPDAPMREHQQEERLLGADAAECRSFAERGLELAALNHRVVGVSSQSSSRQMSLATQEALPHVMLSDGRLDLAEEMGLPTFESDGLCLYERLTLVVRDGQVEKVFYPVPDPATHAAEVAEWLRSGAG